MLKEAPFGLAASVFKTCVSTCTCSISRLAFSPIPKSQMQKKKTGRKRGLTKKCHSFERRMFLYCRVLGAYRSLHGRYVLRHADQKNISCQNSLCRCAAWPLLQSDDSTCLSCRDPQRPLRRAVRCILPSGDDVEQPMSRLPAFVLVIANWLLMECQGLFQKRCHHVLRVQTQTPSLFCVARWALFRSC